MNFQNRKKLSAVCTAVVNTRAFGTEKKVYRRNGARYKAHAETERRNFNNERSRKFAEESLKVRSPIFLSAA